MTEERRRSPALGAALITLVTVELTRVFLPLTIVVLPVTTTLPVAGAHTLAALALVVVPALAAFTVTAGPRRVWLTAGSVALLGRGTLLLDTDPRVQAVAAGLGAAAGLVALVALASGASAGRATRVGVMVGLASEAVVRVTVGGTGLVWSEAPLSAVATILVLAWLGSTLTRTADRLLPSGAMTGPPAWAWWWLLPALTIHGLLLAAPGRIAVATGWSPAQVAATVATVQIVAVLAALLAPRAPTSRTTVVGATLLVVGVAAALPAAGWAGVLGPAAAAAGLGLLAGSETGTGTTVPRRRARAAAAAVALAGALNLAAELGPDLGLPVNPRLLLLILALAAGLLAVHAGRRVQPSTLRAKLRPDTALAAAGTAAAVIALATLSAGVPSTDVVRADDTELTVAIIDVSSGFGIDGRYDPARQAALLARYDLDVLVLNGVDRGRWSTGGQDLLPTFAAVLDLPHVRFAPAAGEVSGHALLTRFPVEEFLVEALPSGNRPPRHSHLAAVLALPDGGVLGVVGAGLAHGVSADELQLPQARAVAGTVARLRERSIPTVLLGDLGPAESTATLESFEPLLESAMPEGARTYPSPAPTELRGHVLLSPELRRSTIAIPGEPVALQLPVVVTLEHR